jgi:hypothetical protein
LRDELISSEPRMLGQLVTPNRAAYAIVGLIAAM